MTILETDVTVKKRNAKRMMIGNSTFSGSIAESCRLVQGSYRLEPGTLPRVAGRNYHERVGPDGASTVKRKRISVIETSINPYL